MQTEPICKITNEKKDKASVTLFILNETYDYIALLKLS